MAATTLSALEASLVGLPSAGRFGPAGACYATRARLAAGEAFPAATNAVARIERHREALQAATAYGFQGPTDLTLLTGP
jgi:hypothetical protein